MTSVPVAALAVAVIVLATSDVKGERAWQGACRRPKEDTRGRDGPITGRNTAQLAREFGLTEVRIYQIIKLVRDEQALRGELEGLPRR